MGTTLKIDQQNIKNEDEVIINSKELQELLNSDVSKCIFKMKFSIEKDGKKATKIGTGFICKISNIKAFITNNHVLDQKFLDNEKKLLIYNDNDEAKEINLEVNRFKCTDEELDFTIIEILKEDNFIYYLEIDEFIDSTYYENAQICIFQYPGGKPLQYSQGTNSGLNNNYFIYSAGTLGGSSGSPLMLIKNKKIIGLHKAGCGVKKDKKNIGIPMNLIIKKMNFIRSIEKENYIKCIYNIKEKDIGKKIQIINNKYDYDLFWYNKKNNEIENKIKIMINGEEIKSLTYKFTQLGKKTVYLIEKEPIITMSGMFYECKCLENIISSFKTCKVNEMSWMFCGCSSLKEINLSSFKTDNVTNMMKMFYGCSSLEEINLSSFKTDNVTNMTDMFCGCSSLKEINLSSFKTDNVTNMMEMFCGCSSLKEINLSSFRTGSVTDMSLMFCGCSSLKEINLSSFKTDNVTNMMKMFSNCTSLKEINLSSFKTEKVTNMMEMFSDCVSLKEINISSFKTEKVTMKKDNFLISSTFGPIIWYKKLFTKDRITNGRVTDISRMFNNISKSCSLICNDINILEKFKRNKCLIFLVILFYIPLLYIFFYFVFKILGYFFNFISPFLRIIAAIPFIQHINEHPNDGKNNEYFHYVEKLLPNGNIEELRKQLGLT